MSVWRTSATYITKSLNRVTKTAKLTNSYFTWYSLYNYLHILAKAVCEHGCLFLENALATEIDWAIPQNNLQRIHLFQWVFELLLCSLVERCLHIFVLKKKIVKPINQLQYKKTSYACFVISSFLLFTKEATNPLFPLCRSNTSSIIAWKQQ